MTDKKGFTRFDNQRIKLVMGPHVAKKIDEEFSAVLDFTAASIQFLEDLLQSSNIQFTKGSMNTDEEVGNAIIIKVYASGTHALTFSSNFLAVRNDFSGEAGTFDLFFMLMPDGKIRYSMIQRTS